MKFVADGFIGVLESKCSRSLSGLTQSDIYMY